MGPAYTQRVNIVTGTSTSVINFDAYAFHEQYHEFMNSGTATDPTDIRRKVSAVQAAARPLVVKERRKRGRGDASDHTYLGPWAGYEDEEEARKSCLQKGALTAEQLRERKELGLDGEGGAGAAAGAGAGKDGAAAGAGGAGTDAAAAATGDDDAGKADEEDEKETGYSDNDGVKMEKRRRGAPKSMPAYRAGMSKEETKTVFHGKQQRDYQGRSWIEPPRGVRPDNDHECFVPKKCLHTYTGHTKGVQVCCPAALPRVGVWCTIQRLARLRRRSLLRLFSQPHCGQSLAPPLFPFVSPCTAGR
jgi:hypothetical protein